MKGNNELHICQEMMIEIVEYWLNNKALNPDEVAPRVVRVKASTGPNDWGFQIKMAEDNHQTQEK